MARVFLLLLEILSNMFPFPCHSPNVPLENATTGSLLRLKHPHSNYKRKIFKRLHIFKIIFTSICKPRATET